MNKIRKRVQDIVKEYGSAEPDEICEKMGIIILSRDLPESVNGFAMQCRGRWFIVLNSMLDHDRKRFTAAHELGHIIMHGCTNSLSLSLNTYFCMSKYEREADMFAAWLLLTAEEYDRCCDECGTITVQQAFKIAHIPEDKADELFF